VVRRKTNGIAYLSSGLPLDEAKPTLIFIHGAAGSHVLRQRQVDGLAGRANAGAIDLPGHADSDGDGLRTIEDYARGAADFTGAVGAALCRSLTGYIEGLLVRLIVI
jgi:pimeloyl-ACP methyl ester carboxylesterase